MDRTCLGWALTGASQSERSPKVESTKGKAVNPGICKETKMDTANPTQTKSNRQQHLYSHHTTSSTYTTMSNTTGPILFPLSG